MSTTLNESAPTGARHDRGEAFQSCRKHRTQPAEVQGDGDDESFVGLVSSLLWKLEIRALAALYKSDDEDQALRIITTDFREPIHRQMRDRVMQAWKAASDEGKTLVDALHTLEDEEAWWIRCQLPTAVSEITENETRARLALAQLWEEVCHG